MYNKGNILDISLKSEGVRFNIVGKELTIWNSYFSITPEELENFEQNDIKIGFAFQCGVLLVLYKLGCNSWVDLTYSYHYAQWLHETGQDDFIEPSIGSLKDDEPLLLKVYLMDSDTKTIVGKRVHQLPSYLKSEMALWVEKQKHEKLPFINSTSKGAKIQAFQLFRDFIHQQPMEDLIKNTKIHTLKL